jgi:prepilin-type N-terminal cleavage/methylation domain-containing protein
MRFEHLSQFLGDVKMKGRKGFTLIELMVVIFIVGILAAVAIPIMRGRIDSAKWSEGKAGAGSVRTAARAFCAEKGSSYTYPGTSLSDLGFQAGDLDGKYFTDAAYAVTWTGYDDYLITVTASDSTSSEKPSTPSVVTLDEEGAWAETP